MDKRIWSVTARCVVQKSIICENCTEEEARKNPFEFAVDELETDQEDYTILSVEEVNSYIKGRL